MIIKSYVAGEISPEEAKVGWISDEDEHVKRHSCLRSCVDGFLEYEVDGQKGILVIFRDESPPQPNGIWVPGGEWKRGVLDPIEAIRIKVKEETNLDIINPEYLGMASMLWEDGPFNNEESKEERKRRNLGEGIHDIGHAFFAKAVGTLKLKSISPPIILVNSENYEEIMNRYNVHGYISFFIKEALKRIS